MGNKPCPGTCICTSSSSHDQHEGLNLDKKRKGPSHALKIRPLLCDLEEEFAKSANKDGTINAKQLAVIWADCAEKKVGQLSQKDRDTITESAQEYLQIMDLDGNGSIDGSEFFTFMLGGLDSRGPFRQMRESLRQKVQQDPKALQAMMADFRHWDADGNGTITKEELQSKMKEIKANNTIHSESDAAFIESLLAAMDVDDDGKIDLWEFIAYSLGRRKSPVELLLYDISHGLSQRWSTVLLGRSFEAIYHSGTLVHGHEIWYGGQLFMNEPPMSKVFGPPLDKSDKCEFKPSKNKPGLMCYHIGETLYTMQEIMTFLSGDINSKYTAANYDVLTHNCNCFSQELTLFLTGDGIPEAVRNLPELVMKTPTARLLRPLLNRWLGGFKHGDVHDNPEDHHDFSKKMEASVEELTLDKVCDGFLESQGGVVSVDIGLIDGDEPSGEVQFAQVSGVNGDKIDIKYFDPEACAFVERKDVPKSLCQPVSVAEHKDQVQSLAVMSAIHSAGNSEFEEDRKLHKDVHKHAKEAKEKVGQKMQKMEEKVHNKKEQLAEMIHHHGNKTKVGNKAKK